MLPPVNSINPYRHRVLSLSSPHSFCFHPTARLYVKTIILFISDLISMCNPFLRLVLPLLLFDIARTLDPHLSVFSEY